jgi:CheY-like chemotaxis protein
MKRILLVDDDPLVLRLYKRGLSQQRVQVDTAGDGLAAINALRAGKPDLVVLDLMMPKFSGVDVLKFIRSQPELKSLPVVVLSNSYMNDLTEEAATLGVQKALLKVRCSPSILFGAINNILEGKTTDEDASLLAVPEQAPPVPESPARIGAKTPKTPPPAPTEAQTTTAEFQAQARRGFLRDAPATCIALRSLCRAFATAPNEAERNLRLQALCRKVHFIAATASLAECHRLAQMASVFEALLFELSNRPVSISASVLRTIASSVDFLAHLFDCARDADLDAPLSAQVLAVDDDPLTSRLVVAALLCAHLQVRSTADPLVGLQWLKETHFDLVLLDIQMPGIDGFELCRRLRLLPGHQKTPVIFVTSHSDFENRARSVLSGGDDLISKPVFPLELVVKAVAHLLKSQAAPRQPRLVRPDSSVRGHAS